MSDDPIPTTPPPAAVAQDMAAIFGDGQRADRPRRPPPPPAPAVRRGGVRPGVALLLLGALGVSVAGGVMLGRDAVGPQVPPPGATTLASRSAGPLRAPPPTAPVAAPVEAPPATAPSPPAVAQQAAPPPVRDMPPRLAAAPRPAAEPSAAPAAYTPPPRAIRTRCFGEEDCLAVRLYESDGEVARAYAAATNAGVRARTLREYRDEWLRARDLGERRPREALRIYGMIAADLLDLAEDAALDERMPRS